jgi:hypothetical protein
MKTKLDHSHEKTIVRRKNAPNCNGSGGKSQKKIGKLIEKTTQNPSGSNP